MSVSWGNPDAHNAAYKKALDEFFESHPTEPRRPFYELERQDQTAILARQVEIYQDVRS